MNDLMPKKPNETYLDMKDCKTILWNITRKIKGFAFKDMTVLEEYKNHDKEAEKFGFKMQELYVYDPTIEWDIEAIYE